MALRRLRPALTPAPGGAIEGNAGSRAGNGCQGAWPGVDLAVGCGFDLCFSLFYWQNSLVVEHIFEYNGGMQLGDSTATTREPRSRLDEALDNFDAALTDLIGTVETGGLDQLSADEKVAVWQKLRNHPQPAAAHRSPDDRRR